MGDPSSPTIWMVLLEIIVDPSQVHFDDNLVEFINAVNYHVDRIVMKR